MPKSFLRDRNGKTSVTNIELFFDLIYVYAVTQMSENLLGEGHHPTWSTAFQTMILLGLVWPAWVYTTWLTNWLDPDRDPLRLLLIALMLVSLAVSAALPEAFGHWGLLIGVGFAVMHIGRSAVAVALLGGDDAKRANFQRILCWCMLSGLVAIAGGTADGHLRDVLWIAVIAIDAIGGAIGFYVPGLGRSEIADWTIDGGHFAERCQAFILIALGESLVIIGSSLADEFRREDSVPAARIAAFVGAFIGAVGLWWVYFDRSGPAGAEVIARADDPGRLGRSAYHYVHPIMVAGIIVTAASDELVLKAPTEPAIASTAWTVLGGTALFLLGHAAFTALVWRTVPWTRLGAVVALGVVGVFATHISALTVGILDGLVILAVCISDRLVFPHAYASSD